MEILDEIKKDYVRDVIKKGKRADGRRFDEFRKISIEKGIIPAAEGSAMVKLGDTQVLVGVKFGTGMPFADRPDEGILATNAELLPMASPTFEPGPPDENSVELARIVDRGIRSSGIVDLKSLFIEEEKVWALFIDIYVLDHDGNLIDASALAAMAALLNTKLPKYEDGKIIRGEFSRDLAPTSKVVTCTFAKIGSQIILDPSLDEDNAMDARLTLATTPEFVCAGQKGKKGGFSREEIGGLVDVAFKKGNELRALL